VNRTAQSIANRLSLRSPQARSLEILAAVADGVPLKKGADVDAALETVRNGFPSVESFERDFPSICFALATGVGKTRLMGAFIAYLHVQKGIRHFFVLAPNLTIYEKLKTDFTPNTPKYVFQGIAEFASSPPLVITGDNYENQRVVRHVDGRKGQTSLFDDTVHINVFNISKLNKDASEKKGTPRIKRLSEYIGQSYFEYLAELSDLVLLMDESHRYRADAGVRVLNELRPVLGLELTATPQVETGQRSVAFKNVIYSYPLSEALKDGFVKEPAVATRKDFDAKSYTKEQLELLKLEDAVRVHETVKVDLEVYARETGQPLVKPFVLIIAEDTEHASVIEKTIKSDEFFGGRYRERVITVHSNKTGEERDEVVQRLVDVEKAGEPTEIVIHVNMLKEGWDVTNLYTIVPLRAANSKTLIEQSIGRGLRLPFGKRTGVKAIDRLTIIAHDRFQSIIDEAQKPDSVIRTGVVIGVDIPQVGQKAVVVPPTIETKLFGGGATERGSDGAPKPIGVAAVAGTLTKPEEVEVARRVLDQIKRASRDPLQYPTTASLGSESGQIRMVSDVLASYGSTQPALPGFENLVRRVVGVVTSTVAAGTIGIPRIVVVPSGEVTSGYHEFDLDTAQIASLKPVDKAILVKHLRDTSVLDEIGVGDEGPPEERLEDYIVRALIDYDDVDYQTQAPLLNKLSEQAVAALRANISEPAGVRNVVLYFQRTLAKLLHAQMQEHFWQSATSYDAKVHQGFVSPPEVTYPVPADEGFTDFRLAVEQKRDIRNMIFGGFRRCLYLAQKFDAEPERRFAVVVEDDKTVEKWFKPARRAFQIDYAPGAAYEPDFVVETVDEKLMIEVKRADQLEHPEVLQKSKAAIEWCKQATDHEKRHGGKPWRYLMVPHDAINEGVSLKGLAAKFAKT
jgi:type III restriction enzyme